MLRKLMLDLGLEVSSTPPTPEQWNLLLDWELREDFPFPLPESCRPAASLEECRERLVRESRGMEEVVVQTDHEGRFVYINDAWTKLSGFSIEEMLGRPSHDFIHPADRDRNLSYYQPMLEGRTDFARYQMRYLKKDGGYLWGEVHTRRIDGPRGEFLGVVGIMRDASRVRAAEEEVRRRDELAKGVAEATEHLLTAPSQGTAVNRALAALGRASGMDRIRVFEFIPDPMSPAPLLSLAHEWVAEGIEPELGKPELQGYPPPPELASIFARLALGEMVAGSTRTMPEDARRFFESDGIRAALIAPIFVESRLWGVLRYDMLRAERTLAAGEKAILGAVANSFAGALARQQALDELRETKEEALASSSAKSTFLATMSHEIRTPLNAVVGMTELLLSTPLQVEQSEYAEAIRASSQVLLSLLNDILDFSRIETGKLDLDARPLEPASCIEGCLKWLDVQARAKGLALRLDVDPRVPRLVLGDGARLRQVLVNVVGNAIKFTERGGVQVDVAATTRREGAGDRATLRFSVRDTGIGIPEDRLGHLFQPFSQIDVSLTRRYGGIGLGLIISRRLVEMMGGEMIVESRSGQGSVFSFTIDVPLLEAAPVPVASAAPSEPAPAPAAARPPAETAKAAEPSAPRILLAEDNIVNQKVAVRMLQRLGYGADVVADGVEAVAAAARQEYDLVLMDINMPEMDGLEACRRIRAAQEGQWGPRIVALTALAMQGDRERCLMAGMDDYVAKPVKIEELQRVVEACRRPTSQNG